MTRYLQPPSTHRIMVNHLIDDHAYSKEWVDAAGTHRLDTAHDESHALGIPSHKHCDHQWSPWSYVMSPAGTRKCSLCGTLQHD